MWWYRFWGSYPNLDLEEINSDITEELGEALALIYKLLFKSRKLLSLNYFR